MTPRPEIRALAGAVRRSAARAADRRGAGRYEGVVLDPDPLRVDVLALDEELDEDDITISELLAAHLAVEPLEVDDVLVLIDSDDDGDYTAVDVLRD